MPTVLRVDGFQVRIYPDDHNPPHVHVYRAGAAVKIALGDAERGVQMIEARGMNWKDAREAVQIVEGHQAMLLDAWRKIHG